MLGQHCVNELQGVLGCHLNIHVNRLGLDPQGLPSNLVFESTLFDLDEIFGLLLALLEHLILFSNVIRVEQIVFDAPVLVKLLQHLFKLNVMGIGLFQEGLLLGSHRLSSLMELFRAKLRLIWGLGGGLLPKRLIRENSRRVRGDIIYVNIFIWGEIANFVGHEVMRFS